MYSNFFSGQPYSFFFTPLFSFITFPVLDQNFTEPALPWTFQFLDVLSELHYELVNNLDKNGGDLSVFFNAHVFFKNYMGNITILDRLVWYVLGDFIPYHSKAPVEPHYVSFLSLF